MEFPPLSQIYLTLIKNFPGNGYSTTIDSCYPSPINADSANGNTVSLNNKEDLNDL
jgi:hypothetical protein